MGVIMGNTQKFNIFFHVYILIIKEILKIIKKLQNFGLQRG